MRFPKLLAFGSIAVGAFTIGSCAIPQAPVECNTATPMFAFYTLESGDPASECGAYGGDYIVTQRYLAPGSKDARLGVLAANGALGAPFVEGRETADDPDLAHESAFGDFKTLNPDDNGICDLVNVTDGYETFVAIPGDPGDPDAGVAPTPDVPELTIRHAYEGVRVLSSAQIPGTLMDGHVTITRDSCTAKYAFNAVYPVHTCDPSLPKNSRGRDPDCDWEADPENGYATGSGMNGLYEPYCRVLDGKADVANLLVCPTDSEGNCVATISKGDPDLPQIGICFPSKNIDSFINK